MPPPAEPSIQRFTVRSADEADEPRSRRELNALCALGAVLDTPAWWTTMKQHGHEQRKRMTEIEAALVRANVSQVLAVWPRDGALDELRTQLQEIAAVTIQRTKKSRIEELLVHVLYPAPSQDPAFAEGGADEGDDDSQADDSEADDEDDDVEGEDDSDDETALDEDDNVVSFDVAVEQAKQTHGMVGTGEDLDGDATMDAEESDDDEADEDDVLAAHKEKDPFAQIAWFVTMCVVREKLLALAPADWTDTRVSAIVDEVSTRLNEEVIARTCALILAVVRTQEGHERCSMETVKAHVPAETRDDVLELLQLHFQAIDQVLATTKDDLLSVLDVVVKQLALPAKDDAMDTLDALCTPGPVPHSWMSDGSITTQLKAKFVSEIAALENVSAEDQDWRPDSNGQVLDLIDPSLHCGLVGQTLRLPQSAAKRMYGSPVEHLHAIMFALAKSKLTGPKNKSTVFQWLPCEIDVDEQEDGGAASILTYINNLHPEMHAGLYASIEQIYAQFVPLFETVLSSLDDQASERAMKALYERHGATLPCAPALVPPGLFETSDPQRVLKGTRCQVIVKLAEIHLTPAKPSYPGDSWHVEGSDAERIIATGLYCFCSENVTTPQISFRTFVKIPEHEQGDKVDVGLAYGLRTHQLPVQHVGRLTAREDRCVVFPNIYQHKVEPFKLIDPAKPGVMKVLTFFLVDPTGAPIPSTAVVPPQQQAWIDRAHEPQTKRARVAASVGSMQTKNTIREGMSLEQAKLNRIKLMAERSLVGLEDDFQDGIVICED